MKAIATSCDAITALVQMLLHGWQCCTAVVGVAADAIWHMPCMGISTAALS
jgi:hypothetical protein